MLGKNEDKYLNLTPWEFYLIQRNKRNNAHKAGELQFKLHFRYNKFPLKYLKKSFNKCEILILWD